MLPTAPLALVLCWWSLEMETNSKCALLCGEGGFLKGEVRFASLAKLYPERAEELLQKTEEYAKIRYNTYKRLASEE